MDCDLCGREESERVECVLCGQEPATVGDHCKLCHEYKEYWNNLTPEERRDEDKAIAEYVEESIWRDREGGT